MFKIQITAAKSLTQAHTSAWREILSAQQSVNGPILTGPHFTPDICKVFGQVRPGAAVCVVRDGSDIIGFLPLYREKKSQATPIGGHLSDFQGAVYRPDAEWNLSHVLRCAKIRRLKFTDWVEPNRSLDNSGTVHHASPYIDLSEGFEAYRVDRRQHTRELQEGLRKSRKLARDVGELRIAPYCDDRTVLTQLLTWKSEQMQAAKKWNALQLPWTRQVFDAALSQRSDQFAGMLTALWAGDELIAGTMGVRSQNVLHGWVTAYSPKYGKYSPGLILILELAQHCDKLGIERIDMGRGDESFKTSFASGAIDVHEGLVDSAQWSTWLHRITAHAKESIRGTWLGRPIKQIIQRARFATRRPV